VNLIGRANPLPLEGSTDTADGAASAATNELQMQKQIAVRARTFPNAPRLVWVLTSFIAPALPGSAATGRTNLQLRSLLPADSVLSSGLVSEMDEWIGNMISFSRQQA
jgi:hypothetical protein